jgi:hypothetical protein
MLAAVGATYRFAVTAASHSVGDELAFVAGAPALLAGSGG